jgi:type IV secretion system protein VirB8
MIKEDLSWSQDLYGKTIVQRNLLFILSIILAIALVLSLIWMQINNSESKIKPFVIEIDKKTGVATTVKPLTSNEYSANLAVVRSLIINYIRAREEYSDGLFDRNFLDIVRVFSDPNIYYNYKNLFNKNNPQSPYNILSKTGMSKVKWKSIIFPKDGTAQIRITLQIYNSKDNKSVEINKIILMAFEFNESLQLNEEDRLINPLGFNVTLYQIEDENPNI